MSAAFCRVHRLGQKNETYITRFMVRDTVDEKLLEMQKEKKEVIGAAMDDRTVMPELSLTELMKLFGDVAYDENSKPFILVDDMVDTGAKKTAAPTSGATSTS